MLVAKRYLPGMVLHIISPFGFKNIPSDFQQIMAKIFEDIPFFMVYIDDIVIASDSYADHLRHVRMVFQRLNQVNLRVNLDKCVFAQDKLIILGNEVSREGIRPAVEKLLKMDHWESPKTLKMLQRQLRFLNYFRDYIPKYAEILAPIQA